MGRFGESGRGHDNRPNRKTTKAQVKAAMLEHGNISAAAKALGVNRRTIQDHTDRMVRDGEMKPRVESNPSRWRAADEIISARKAEFDRVKTAGLGKVGNIVHLADDGPFCIFFLGDPHLDSPGTDLALWERWIEPLDYRKHVHGFGLGDWLDAWPRALAFLYGAAETAAPEGLILLEHYLDRIGEHLIGSVGGNHDTWSGYNDVLGEMMRSRGVLHRANSLDLVVKGPAGREVTIGARHSWPGRSMWNETHGIKRAAMMGRRETILVGGHTHVSGEARVKHSDSGAYTWCIQAAAFKVEDDYGDQLGLPDKHASPAVAAVIDPIRPETDPQRVTLFLDPEAAVDYLAMLRRSAKARVAA